MKSVLNESAILRRMTREEATNVKGGTNTVSPSILSTLCLKPTLSSVCDCLLAGCGCRPSQVDCNRCLCSSDPSEK